MDCSLMIETHIQWKRPAENEIQYPNVWYRFETKSRDGHTYKIRIQDLTEDRFDEAIDLLTKDYITDEPICAASKLLDDGPALKFYQQWMRQVMSHRVSLVAVIDDDSPRPQIVAMQCLLVETKGDRLFHPDAMNATLHKMWQLFDKIEETCNPFEVLNSNTYLQDWGLCTSSEFRGMGISSTILRTLTCMGQRFKLKGSLIHFTRTCTQKMAEKAGFKCFREFAYNDYKNEKGEVILPVVGADTLKFMAKIF